MMQEPGKRPSLMAIDSLVAIDTDIAWDKIGHPTAPATAPRQRTAHMKQGDFSMLKRTLQDDITTTALQSLRRWDDPGAKITAMKALSILFDLREVPEACNAAMRRGVDAAVADGLHPDDFVRSHTNLLASSWLADGWEGGGGGWPQSLPAPYETGNFSPSILEVAMRPVSPGHHQHRQRSKSTKSTYGENANNVRVL